MQKEEEFYLDKNSIFKYIPVSPMSSLCGKILLSHNMEASLYNVNEVLGAVFYYQKLQDKVGINYLPAAFWKPLLALDNKITPAWRAGIEYMTKSSLSRLERQELSTFLSVAQVKAKVKLTAKY